MKWQSPLVRIALVVVLVLAVAGGAFAVVRSRPGPSPSAPAAVTLPVSGTGSGFTLGTAPGIVRLASDWPAVTLANSDVRLSYPPAWSADPHLSPGSLVMSPESNTGQAPAANISFTVLNQPIDSIVRAAGHWTPITILGMHGYYAQQTGLAVPTEAYNLVLPDGPRTLWIAATAGPAQNLVPELEQILAGLHIGTMSTGGGAGARVPLLAPAARAAAMTGPGSHVVALSQYLHDSPLTLAPGIIDRGDYDCAAASLTMILRYYATMPSNMSSGIVTDYATVIRALRNFPQAPATQNPAFARDMPWQGIGAQDEVRDDVPALSGNVLQADVEQWTVGTWKQNMLAQLQAGHPFIAFIPDWSGLEAHESGSYAHSIVVVGMDTAGQFVYYDNPDTGSLQQLSLADFQTAWQNGKDFVAELVGHAAIGFLN